MTNNRHSNESRRNVASGNIRLRPQQIQQVERRERAMLVNRQRREERVARYRRNFQRWSPLGWATESSLVLMLVSLFKAAFARTESQASRQNLYLATEHLEERQLLAAVTVGTTVDAVNGDTTSITNLIATPGDDGISLREAVEAAQNTAGADTITFDSSLTAGGDATINLSIFDTGTDGGPAATSEFGATAFIIRAESGGNNNLTIEGPTGDNGITIARDSSSDFRLFHVQKDQTLTLNNLTLTGGVARGASVEGTNAGAAAGMGGAIFNQGTTVIQNSLLTGNSAIGGNSRSGDNYDGAGASVGGTGPNAGTSPGVNGGFGGGGGAAETDYMGPNNVNAGHGGFGAGGGGADTLYDLSVARGGNGGFGGGAGKASRFPGTSGFGGSDSGAGAGMGGAVFNAGGNLTITNSTVSGNSATGGVLNITSQGDPSTSPGTRGSGMGAGVFSRNGNLIISHGTFANNTVTNGAASGAALFFVADGSGAADDMGTGILAGIDHSIFADSNGGSDTALVTLNSGTSGFNSDFNFVETDDGDALNLDPTTGVDPQLSALADNGGSTNSHLPQSTSPVINVGASGIIDGAVDQRGPGFSRLQLEQRDLGAVEIVSAIPSQGLVVSTLVDELDNDFSAGDVSLREAIAIANDVAGANTITFDSGLAGGTILLGGTELEITESTVIDASALTEHVTADAQQGSRVLRFSATTGELTVKGLNIQNGLALSTPGGNVGGGIMFNSNGVLNIEVSRISGNRAGEQSTYTSGHGGGIWSRGAVNVTNSSVSNNFANAYGYGGGIHANNSDVTITNSTVSGNLAYQGGGILTNAGEVKVINGTVSGNRVERSFSYGGGIKTTSGNITVESSTVANNTASATSFGGGLSTNANLIVTNSIIAGNSTAFNANPDLRVGGTITVNNSLIGNNKDTSLTESQTPDANGNLIGSNSNIINPMLEPLADNGGPTRTHALKTGSPAKDAAGATMLTSDQRGTPFVRVSGAAADMGAYELQTINLVVDTTVDELDGDYSAGDLSLREAIALANVNPGTDTITFASGAGEAFENGGTIFLASDLNDVMITASLMIDGDLNNDGIPDITIDADSGAGLDDADSRVFTIDDGGELTTIDVTIDGLTIRDGDTTDDGGGIFLGASDRLTLNDSVVTGNTGRDGGGVYSEDDSHLKLFQTSITNNRSTGDGAGIYIDNRSTLLVENSEITGNEGTGRYSEGGGIYTDNNTTVTISGSTVSNNTATWDGGGIGVNDGSSLTIIDSTISGNVSAEEGGGIFHDGSSGAIAGRLTIINSTISGNRAEEGGGLYFESGGGTRSFLTVISSTIANNRAEGEGGGVYLTEDIDATITNSTISGNRAGESGGGIYAEASNTGIGATLTLANSIVAGNFAATAGDDLFAPDEGATLAGAGQNIVGSAPVGFGEDLGDNSIVLGDGNSFGIDDIFANIVTVDPDGTLGNGDEFESGLLTDNGGNVETVALREHFSNPAVDAGDPTAAISLDETALGIDLNNDGDTDDTLTQISDIAFDSRGAGFDRIVAALSSLALPDLGAYEAAAPADNARISIVDGELTFNGDDIDDVIIITETETDILITYNGQPLWPVSKSGITELRVLTKAGDDTVRARMLDNSMINLFIDLGADNDIANVSGGSATEIRGGTGDDRITGGDGANTIFGDQGNDIIRGGLNDDAISGGGGNDMIRGGAGNDLIRGGRGDDLLIGNDGHDHLRGHAGDDTLRGSKGNDTILGGLGNDDILGNGGDDTLRGSEGDNTIDGGVGNDRIFGNAGNDILRGNKGDDIIEGGVGNDMIFGHAGNDTLRGGGGDDMIRGGIGDDELFGNAGNDTLHGNQGEDIIDGGVGDDVMFGNGGNDTLRGGHDNDIINGGIGDDGIFGNDGNDLLIGGSGMDNLKGGTGGDIAIGSSITYANDQSALQSVLTIWTQGDPAQTRIDAIQASSTPLTPRTVVLDDNTPDTADSGPDDDWGIVAANDVQVDMPEFLTFL